MEIANRLIIGIPVALFLATPGSMNAASSQAKIDFASNIGLQAGKQYCAKKSARESIEKGTAIAMAQTRISMSVINSMDFEDETYTIPMIEGMLSYAIDHCPSRAKRLFRDISESD